MNIGRDPSNDIVINEPVVSAFHCQIRRENNALVLIHPHPSHQKTTNGLLYKGHHYKGTESFRHALVRGDVFRIGNEYGTLVTITYNDVSGAPQEVVPTIPTIVLVSQH